MATVPEVPATDDPPPPRQQEQQNAVAAWATEVRSAPEWRYIMSDIFVKALAPLYYFFCETLISKNFIINFVVTTVLVVCEFWHTKNIVGRRLVGMRWWQVPSQDSRDAPWRFEAKILSQGDFKPSRAASTQFWGGMLVLAVYWVLMGFLNIREPGYFILCAMALTFVGMNFLGYYRCRSWSAAEFKAMQGGGGIGNFVSGLTSGVASNFMVHQRK